MHSNLCLIILGLYGTVLTTFTAIPECPATPPAGGNWQLIWSDEFDSGSTPEYPNPDNWGYETGYVRNREWQYYTNNIQNAYCQDGFLHIEAHKHPDGTWPVGNETGQDGSISSASLRSRNKVEHRYGWLEMRGRIDTQWGSWPAFWSLGVSGEWPDNGECDIMEYYRDMLLFNVAWWKTGDARWTPRWDSEHIKVSSLEPGWSDKFHVWAMEWTPRQVKLYMDGVLYNTWNSSLDSGDSSIQGFQQPHYIILNQAIGGNGGGDASGIVYPTRYEVDYVRWYQDFSQQPAHIVNDDDPAISYSGTWGIWEGNPGYQQDEHFSETADSTATCTFTGTKVWYYGFKRNDLGYADILLDGELVDTVDCYAGDAEYYTELYESPEMPYGEHTLTVRVTGTNNPSSSGFEIIVDAFGYSAEQSDTTPPAVPANVSAAAGGGSILLNWNDNTEDDFAEYRIYRSPIPTSYSTPMDSITDSYYIDRTLQAGTRYYYVITAVDDLGNESAYSPGLAAPMFKGDLTINGVVDLNDLKELADGWITRYDADMLINMAVDWLNAEETNAGGTTYYIDSLDGNDGHTGLSPHQAWKTLDKVNSRVYEPGDEILFKAGTAYTGQLRPEGSGAADWPIVVDMYGSGSKPVIEGSGHLAAVHLEGIEYWEVNNLELINNKGTAQETDADEKRYGVYLRALETGPRRHLYLKHLYIHDIYAPEAVHGQAIAVESDGDTVRTHFADILVEDCHIQNTATHGIWLQHKNWWHGADIFAYNQDIIIRNNILENVGGPGIQPNHCKQVLIEHNTVESGQPGPDQRGRGSGFWNWHCEDVTVQYNTFMHARGEGDSCGAHVDIGNINTLIQYNLSYDNAGGFVEILGDSDNTVYRYNISINDGWRVKGVDGAIQHGHIIWLGGWTGSNSPKRGPGNSHIYNNTIYLASGLETRFLLEDTAENAFIRNNIFYIDGTVLDENPGSAAANMIFDTNLTTRPLPPTLPADPHNIHADPLLVNPGGTTPADYRLQSNSPAIDTGLIIPDNGAADYWGSPLISTPDIGAHEKQ